MNLSPRENWRIYLLLVLLLVSTVAVFVPLGGADTDDSQTNLEYGLELSGGTRVRAPLVGMTAEVELEGASARDIESSVASQLNRSRTDVQVREVRDGQDTVELFANEANGNITQADFAAALQTSGLDATTDDVRPGVTEATRQTAVNVLDSKINSVGLSGGTVSTTRTPTGETFILVEVPNANRSEVLRLITSRGQVELVAHFPQQGGNETTYRNVGLLTQEDFANQNFQAAQAEGNQPARVPVSLRQDPAQNFSDAMQSFGFTDEGIGSCGYRPESGEDPDTYPGYCLYTVRDGEVVYGASMSPGLARTIRSGDFVKDPAFVITANNFSEAQQLAIDLQAGALPTTLDIEGQGTTYFLEPSLANEFKLFSLITALVAVFAVAGMVFLRYREPGVAAPMVLTAGAEVFLLLGFASAVGLALDLSHIAGFIAVIGTGVDDLIIIADEILQSGEVNTSRVFESRFRKAFWVIGAAAATTIIAMSPLAVLSLGDLQGFAIITIVGVLLGVLVTRPAYGDILRTLVLDDV
ncbi:preprotein translocase subunit SecD [Haloglomus irregulare]|uniref:Protein-export membrane protein SecD n=1 Tax=Haloglomus irregulare TaxID=2234134 RepID=A0A554MXB8_9EURY|nr:preprotein translocase subunit SecD [Haloglomus irregulare]TSD09772.1 preprotein translocase subunit SecD [Haloglomus irregulare]